MQNNTIQRKKYSRFIWISKKPMFAPLDLESGRKLFIGFSYGQTYIRKVHGPIGTELIKQQTGN